MKTQPLKRFHREDFPQAPEWFGDALDDFNSWPDSLNPLLDHGIDLDNNVTGERQVVSVTHNVAVTVRLRSLKYVPTFVRVGYAAGFVGSANITGYNGDGTVQVIVFFHGTAPTDPVNAVLYFEP